jgi:malate dehydrogenase (decarboxylating)
MVSLAKWRILNRLHDRNETLYYKVNAIRAKDAYSTNAYLLLSQ